MNHASGLTCMELPTDRGALIYLFFSSRWRHTKFSRDWSSDVCSSDLLICVDVVPAERNEIALKQLADGEGIAGRAPANQQFIAVALALQPLPTHDHGAEEEVAELRGARDQPAQRIGLQDEERARLGNDAPGERRLAREHRDVADERPRLTLREVVIAVRLAVDDVDGSR